MHLELERARQVFEEKVVEQSRHLSWLIAVINSPEKLSDIAWLFDKALRTIERASQLNPFFDFMPEFYINVTVDCYTALKNFFKLSQNPFSSLPSESRRFSAVYDACRLRVVYCGLIGCLDYQELLGRYGSFIAKHFADPRIVNVGEYPITGYVTVK